MVSVVQAVRAVDSLQRIPEAYRQSFFGQYDVWRYEGIADNVLCEECLKHWLQFYYRGNELRAKFKYLEILDENTIAVNVHPHCRCKLHRVTSSHEYLYFLEHYS